MCRLLLGRAASAAEADRWRDLASVDALRALCLDSAEFRTVMQHHGVVTPPPVPPPRLPFDLP